MDIMPSSTSSHLRSCLGVLVLGVCLVFTSACGRTLDKKIDTPPILVAAASDLRPAFEELAKSFTADTEIAVSFSFGSSGQLREQIVNGAPFDVFASANAEFVNDVIDEGRAVPDTKVNYGVGRIVLWSATAENLPSSFESFQPSRYKRIAIANPQHAPYGLAAQQALTSAGHWDSSETKIVYGENISDTKKIIDSGNAEIGIIALSLAIADGGTYVDIPESFHAPLLQAAVVTTGGDQEAGARRWIDYMMSERGRQVMSRFGFVAPPQNGITP